MRAEKGFTLLELIIAISLLSLLGLATAITLNNSLQNQQIIEQRIEQLETLNYALNTIRTDLEQAIHRAPDTDPLDLYSSTLVGFDAEQNSTDLLFSFLRNGKRSLPGAKQKNQLQAVSYRLQDKMLIREAANVPTPEDRAQLFEQPLLDDIQQIEIHYFWQQQWLKQWSRENSEKGLPQAVRLRLTTEQWSDVELIILLPGGIS